jgi:hypothetical protein
MSKHTDKSTFPAWFFGPEGESAIFDTAEEVPSGWKDSPAAFADQKQEKVEGRQPADAVTDDSFYEAMGMEELRRQLKGKGIEFHPAAKKEKLISLLKSARPSDTLTEN